MFSKLLLERLKSKAPIALLAETSVRKLLDPGALDRLFGQHAKSQYTRKLLFSDLVDLLASVVLRAKPSVRQAYLNLKDPEATIQAVYDKLKHAEPHVLQQLVRYSARRADALIDSFGKRPRRRGPDPWFGCRQVRILDGNILKGAHHRLQVLRGTRASALAALAVHVYDPRRGVLADFFPCEDGHAQERSLFDDILPTIRRGQLWVGDRNFCTTKLLGAIAKAGAFFVIRRHASTVRVEPLAAERRLGRCDGGVIFEQQVRLTNVPGQPEARQIRVHLDEPIRNGEKDLCILTNLKIRAATARAVAQAYRGRWKIEKHFNQLTVVLNCEIRPLAYPRAALFGMAVAALVSNAWAVAQAALEFSAGRSAEELSYYSLSLALLDQRGSLGLLDESAWEAILSQSDEELGEWLLEVASGVDWERHRKAPTRPKKPRKPRPKCPRIKHVSVYKLLQQQKVQQAKR
jgi:hypothetical protein